MARGCLGILGIGVALFSAFFVVAAIVESITGGDGKTSPGVYAGLIVFFGLLLVCGVVLAWAMFRAQKASVAAGGGGAPTNPPRRTEADYERLVLRLAEEEHGRLTVPETAARCDITIAEAKAALDRLVLMKVATIQVTQSGVLVYVFPGLLSDDDKAGSTDF
ncbi:MAG: hypothetical protein IT204_25265 [Fimbriimonadaceae bacterium]|nr:hypothetical protein [Fimbriimonadaceae bacterium]